MSRFTNRSSRSGFFHVITRGVNKQKIFYDRKDYQRFLNYITELKSVWKVQIAAYCLMSNHVHLLMREDPGSDSISAFMHDLCMSYAMYINRKYDRSGHLFQGRFISRAIETDQYLLICTRYIHKNPSEANISAIDSYPWSSYLAYKKQNRWGDVASHSEQETLGATNDTICDTASIAKLFTSFDDFAEFHDKQNLPSEAALECFENNGVMSDERAKEVICYLIKSQDPGTIQALKPGKRKDIIKKLKAIGINPSQITRLTGLSRFVISHNEWMRQ